MTVSRNGILALTIMLGASGCETAKSVAEELQVAAEDRDSALIWRGFEHAWTGEVHRVARFGSFISLPDGASALNHVAQSGTSPDNAAHALHFDNVSASYTQFVPQTTTIEISGDQRVANTFASRITIPVTPASRLDGKSNLVGLINGFELRNSWTGNRNAQKLGALTISISDPRRVGDEIQIDVSGSILMSCKSTECLRNTEHQRETFSYELDVHALLVASDSSKTTFTTLPVVTNSYGYDSRTPVPETLGAFSNPLVSPVDPALGEPAIGLTSFTFMASKNVSDTLPDSVPHLFTWRMFGSLVGNLQSDPSFDGRAFFAHSANGPSNYGHAGAASISFSPIMMQFSVGDVEHCVFRTTSAFGNAASAANLVSVTGPLLDGTPPENCESTPGISSE